MDSEVLPDNILGSSLFAAGPSPDVPREADIYGFLAGAWELDVVFYRADVRHLNIKADAHFAWILQGLAMQDTWIMRPHGQAGIPRMCGTTLRVWNPRLNAWGITWTDVLSGRRDEMVGRRIGDEIVQLGTRADGVPVRWIFTDITPAFFRWTGEALQADARTWSREAEFLARRVA